MRTLGVRELRDHLSRVLREVKAGESIEIRDRAETVAWLVPAASSPADRLRQLAQSGAISWAGGKPMGSRQAPEVVGPSVADAVIEDRR